MFLTALGTTTDKGRGTPHTTALMLECQPTGDGALSHSRLHQLGHPRLQQITREAAIQQRTRHLNQEEDHDKIEQQR